MGKRIIIINYPRKSEILISDKIGDIFLKINVKILGINNHQLLKRTKKYIIINNNI